MMKKEKHRFPGQVTQILMKIMESINLLILVQILRLIMKMRMMTMKMMTRRSLEHLDLACIVSVGHSVVHVVTVAGVKNPVQDARVVELEILPVMSFLESRSKMMS